MFEIFEHWDYFGWFLRIRKRGVSYYYFEHIARLRRREAQYFTIITGKELGPTIKFITIFIELCIRSQSYITKLDRVLHKSQKLLMKSSQAFKISQLLINTNLKYSAKPSTTQKLQDATAIYSLHLQNTILLFRNPSLTTFRRRINDNIKQKFFQMIQLFCNTCDVSLRAEHNMWQSHFLRAYLIGCT